MWIFIWQCHCDSNFRLCEIINISNFLIIQEDVETAITRDTATRMLHLFLGVWYKGWVEYACHKPWSMWPERFEY